MEFINENIIRELREVDWICEAHRWEYTERSKKREENVPSLVSCILIV